MKQALTRRLFLALIFLISTTVQAATTTTTSKPPVSPYFSIRSQASNLSRLMAGWADFTYLYDQGERVYADTITYEYQSSFRGKDIARCLFGADLVDTNCDCPAIKVSGSGVADRGANDWLADYFGLPTDFESRLEFCPRIQNNIFDFALYLGFDDLFDGSWFRVWMPVVYTKWDLRFKECAINSGNADHAPGYFNGPDGVPRSDLLQNATEFFSLKRAPYLGKSQEDGVANITFRPLESCRFNACNKLERAGLGDLHLAFGWNFLRRKNYHAGLGIILAAPTGSKPNARYIFEPVIGNGHHWELGGLWTSRYVVWRNDQETRKLELHLDAHITHLFEATQQRCFDLKCKPNSRYMLAQRLGTPVETLLAQTDDPSVQGSNANLVAPSAQFKNEFSPVANLTCSEVKVKSNVQADVIFMLQSDCPRWSMNLGYNLWARTCEKIRFACSDCPPRLLDNTWALKGDAHVIGFGAADADDNADASIGLSASQSKATINSGANFVDAFSTNNQNKRNFGVDNAQFAMSDDGNANDQIVYAPNINGGATTQSKTSKDPVFLSLCDIDLNGARTRGLTHKIFGSCLYKFNQKKDCHFYAGFGFEGEFATNTNRCKTSSAQNCTTSSTQSCSTKECKDPCAKCPRCALSQWGVWIKVGIAHN